MARMRGYSCSAGAGGRSGHCVDPGPVTARKVQVITYVYLYPVPRSAHGGPRPTQNSLPALGH